MTDLSAEADSLAEAFAHREVKFREVLGEFLTQVRDHRRFCAEVVAVNEIDP